MLRSSNKQIQPALLKLIQANHSMQKLHTFHIQETARIVEVLNTGLVTTGKFFSSYTRIHVHFFGAPVGKKAEIRRCSVLGKNNPYYETLYNRVKEAEKNGVTSKSLKNSVLLKNTGCKRKIEDAFKMLERDEVDMKIIRGLCANGIPFNVLRNPQFLEMIQAIRKHPMVTSHLHMKRLELHCLINVREKWARHLIR